jgi:hypothetical protein
MCNNTRLSRARGGGFSKLETAKLCSISRGSVSDRWPICHRSRARFPTKFFVVRVSRTASNTHAQPRQGEEVERSEGEERERERERDLRTGVFTHPQFLLALLLLPLPLPLPPLPALPPSFSYLPKHPSSALWDPHPCLLSTFPAFSRSHAHSSILRYPCTTAVCAPVRSASVQYMYITPYSRL